jgi:hypothetical protein
MFDHACSLQNEDNGSTAREIKSGLWFYDFEEWVTCRCKFGTFGLVHMII